VKDVPDVTGDRQFGIRSFSVRAGPKAVLRVAIGMLVCNFAAAAAVLGIAAATAATLATTIRRAFAGVMCLLVAAAIRRRAQGVPPQDAASVYSLYMELWKAFYLSYLCLPLAR